VHTGMRVMRVWRVGHAGVLTRDQLNTELPFALQLTSHCGFASKDTCSRSKSMPCMHAHTHFYSTKNKILSSC
jgi:hypothetical protein